MGAAFSRAANKTKLCLLRSEKETDFLLLQDEVKREMRKDEELEGLQNSMSLGKVGWDGDGECVPGSTADGWRTTGNTGNTGNTGTDRYRRGKAQCHQDAR